MKCKYNKIVNTNSENYEYYTYNGINYKELSAGMC
jgi:hypothetical protein